MIRNIVGYVRVQDKNWRCIMSRMKSRVSHALNIFPIDPWSSQLSKRQFNIARRFVRNINSWPARCILWDPTLFLNNAHRSVGRPRQRWDKYLCEFSCEHHLTADWFYVAGNNVNFFDDV